MYIISKKKDYYDGVVGTVGVDKTIVYNREIVMLEESKDFPVEFRPNKSWNRMRDNHFISLSHYSNYKKKYYTQNSAFIVGFCGKLYIGWKLYREVEFYLGYNELITYFTYDYELIKQYVEPTSWHSNLDDDFNYVKNYNAIDIFRTLKVPIFIYDNDYKKTSLEYRGKNVFIINPNLSEYEFYTVFNSFQAFQEIQMFMGGILGKGEKDIVEVADKYKITQHGFDYKYSFRKEPEKNK
jgi:hypothetical protein